MLCLEIYARCLLETPFEMELMKFFGECYRLCFMVEVQDYIGSFAVFGVESSDFQLIVAIFAAIIMQNDGEI